MTKKAGASPKFNANCKQLPKKQKRRGKNCILAYYQQIRNGEVIVGRWIELLYSKIVAMIESKELYYSAQESYAVIDYIEEHCFHTEGPLAPGPLKLELWQKAFLSCAFGLLEPHSRKRAFREVVLLIGRKNGKSALAASVAKFLFAKAGGYGAAVYCVAPKLDQADIIYNRIWQMCVLDTGDNDGKKKDPTKPRHRMTDLYLEATNSIVKKLAFSSKRSDGFNPSLAIMDEAAAFPAAQGLRQYTVMKSGMGAREAPILMSLTTANYVNDGIFDDLLKRSTRYLLGDSSEKRLLPFLYCIDDVEAWDDISELAKANPNLGVSVKINFLLDEIEVAKSSLANKAEFITKYCNIKQNSSTAWLLAQDVEAICGEKIRLEDFRGCYAVCGVDLSQCVDLTCACVVIERDGVMNVVSQFFMPREKIDEASEREGIPYQAYVARGLLTLSGDHFIDYHDVEDWITSLVSKYHIYPLKVGYDRYSASYFCQSLKEKNFHLDDVFQGENLYSVLNECEALIKDRKINIGDNDLLKMHLLNSAIKMSVERGRGKLVKVAGNLHIDGTAALIDALTMRSKYHSEIGRQLANAKKKR